MTTERWRQIERIFDAVSECPADERETRLRQECGGDHDLRREVDALLACDVEDDNLAENAVQGAAESLARANSGRLLGRQIGPYRVTRAIGQGGMGTVYEGVREGEDYEQRIAIKLLRGGIGTEADVRRFRRERQLLARLDHPNIARLLDGGATDDGLPYIVMEYVDGAPITEYCRERALSTEQKLRLFLQLCHAVQYAHQRLVVHRDIKPGNVLVTADGTPKLLDFGIARLTEWDSGAGSAAQTHTTVLMLTPDYASPEQIRGEAVTAASDIYSLGAVLYELLAGIVPRASAEQRLLRGDLHNIVQMALRQEPDRRYTSVEQFAEDIRRYLDGRPVLARKDTLRYRTAKFLKRNRVPVAAGILLVISLVGGIIATTHQTRRAERRFDEVRKLAHTMLFDVNDKLAPLPATLEARVLIIDTASRYYDSLAKDSEGDEALQWELAQAYSRLARLQAGDLAAESGGGLEPGLGRTADALANLRKALAIEEHLASRHHKIDYELAIMVLYYNIGTLQKDPAAAEAYMVKGLNLANSLKIRGRPWSGPVSLLLWGLGTAQLQAGDPKQALATSRKAPQRPESPFLGFRAMHRLGDPDGALHGYLAGLKGIDEELNKPLGDDLHRRIITKGLGVVLTETAGVLGNRYDLNLGKPDEAVPYVDRAIGIFEQLSQRDPLDVSFKLNLSRAYRMKAALIEATRPGEAVELCRRAAPEDPGAHAQIAYPLRKLGRAQEAQKELDTAIAAALKDEDTILARIELGDLRREQGDGQPAVDAYRQGVALAENAVAKKPHLMPLRMYLADGYERLGMWDKSLAVWQEWTRWGVSSSYDQRRKQRAEKMCAR